jgi:opacity protein-like surface antigen
MRIIFPTLFCFLLCATAASAQSPMATASGETTVVAASGEAAADDASGKAPATAGGKTPVAAAPGGKAPFAVIRAKPPIAGVRGKIFDMGLGYTYVSQAENQSKRGGLGLQGADASFTMWFSRVGIKADVGYARGSNVLGTGRHSDVLSYLVGPVFHPTTRRNFNSYVHALVGGARVSGPVLTNSGIILLGGWTTSYAWAVGGGVEYWLTDSMAIRTGTDYLRTSYYDSSLVVRGQSNLRATATVVYYFGKRSRKRR